MLQFHCDAGRLFTPAGDGREMSERGKRNVRSAGHLNRIFQVTCSFGHPPLLLERHAAEPSRRPEIRVHPDQIVAVAGRKTEVSAEIVQGCELNPEYRRQRIQQVGLLQRLERAIVQAAAKQGDAVEVPRGGVPCVERDRLLETAISGFEIAFVKGGCRSE